MRVDMALLRSNGHRGRRAGGGNSSVLNRALKSVSGRPRRPDATRRRGASSASPGAPRGPSEIRGSSARSSSSCRSASIMALTNPRPEALDSAELERLHGALAPAHSLCYLFAALLLSEPHYDHLALLSWQTVDHLEELYPLLHFDEARLPGFRGVFGKFAEHSLAGCPAVLIGGGVGGDAEQPGRKGDAAPLKAR